MGKKSKKKESQRSLVDRESLRYLAGSAWRGGMILLFIAVMFGAAMLVSGTVTSYRAASELVDEPAAIPRVDAPLRTAEQASQWLEKWAESLPENSANRGSRSKVVTVQDKDHPDRWSVRVERGASETPGIGGWPNFTTAPPVEKFRCVAVTSADGIPFDYGTTSPGLISSFLVDPDCDKYDQKLRVVDKNGGELALKNDWRRLVDALSTPEGRANPYMVADTFTTDTAEYSVEESKAVSASETRLSVRQKAKVTELLSCERMDLWRCGDPELRTDTRTVIVSTGEGGTGPVTVLGE